MAKTIVSHFIDTKQTFFFFPAVLTKPEAGTNFRGEYNSTATTPKVITGCLQLQTMCCTKNSKCLEWISKMSSVRNVRYIFMLILISEPLPLLELLSFSLVSISITIRLLLYKYNHYSVIGLPTVLDLDSYIPGTIFWPFSQRLNPVNDKWRIQYKITLKMSNASTLFLVQLRHTSLSYFISTLLLALFSQLRILASSVSLGWVGGPRGRDPYNTLDLCSGTPFLSLSGIHLHSLHLSQNWKHISFPLHTDLSFYQSITSNACICSVCVCLGVCVRACMCLGVCVCVWWNVSLSIIPCVCHYKYLSRQKYFVMTEMKNHTCGSSRQW